MSQPEQIPPSNDMSPAEMELAMTYYKGLADQMAGLAVKSDSLISATKHQLRQKQQGFALLSDLHQLISTQMEPLRTFSLTIGRVNSMLNMDSTIIFSPVANSGGQRFKPGSWLTANELTAETLEQLEINFQPLLQTEPGFLLVNRKTEKTALVQEIQSQLQLPYFICIPIMVNDQTDGILLSGRLKEVKPFYPPLDQGDVDTFQAIAGFLSAALTNYAISMENARFYQTLETKVAERTAQLADANEEILALNNRLRADNIRMGAELDVARRMQQMILPKPQELAEVEELDIAGFMEPADEVGGDYYDVLYADVIYTEDIITIGIGDVTGHGLESGILMIMVQTAVRTLKTLRETDPIKFLDVLNHTLYQNVQRMGSERSLSLAILNYYKGQVIISGQHEEVLVVRNDGSLERIDTMDLGLPIAMDDDIAKFISQTTVELRAGDGIVLYTDGIPEAYNSQKQQYGIQRMHEVIQENWTDKPAEQVKQAVIDDVHSYIGDQEIADDITLVVFKQRDAF